MSLPLATRAWQVTTLIMITSTLKTVMAQHSYHRPSRGQRDDYSYGRDPYRRPCCTGCSVILMRVRCRMPC
jgi:hypothetical protein